MQEKNYIFLLRHPSTHFVRQYRVCLLSIRQQDWKIQVPQNTFTEIACHQQGTKKAK